MKNQINVLIASSEKEIASRKTLVKYLKNTPIPDEELLSNLGLYLNRQTLSRIMFMNELYKKIVNRHGVVMEFGVRWGQNLSLFSSFRGMHEPYNYNRKIIGFDTFSGFVGVNSKDGDLVNAGDYSVTEKYKDYLNDILKIHQDNSPVPHINKFELIEGDATITVNDYLDKNPHTIISLAYFDFDIYKPTKDCLTSILPFLTKGSIIAFDELNCKEFPGETLAFKEVFDLNKYELKRDIHNPLCSYIEF